MRQQTFDSYFRQLHIILYANNTNKTLSEKRTFKKSTQNTYFTCVLHEKHGKMLIISQYFSQFSSCSQLVYLFKRWSPGLSSHAQRSSTQALRAPAPSSKGKLGPNDGKTTTALPRQPRHREHRLGLALANSGRMCPHQSPASDTDRRILGCGGRRWTSRWRSD